MTRSKNEYAPERLLRNMGFSDEDLQTLADHGQSPHEVYADVERFIEMGMTNEKYARETYEEAYPERFSDDVVQLTESQPVALKYDKSDKLKNEISNFVEIMRHDAHYQGIKYNEVSGRAEVHTVKGGKVKIEPWTDADEAQSMMHIEQTYGIFYIVGA